MGPGVEGRGLRKTNTPKHVLLIILSYSRFYFLDNFLQRAVLVRGVIDKL